mmetsp:Transcript_64256/g.182462  ORF Transcript_64256/g.182462 Transcript_64256/m.182462 type:complete len:86 (-) Transcript_64256:38-295(-)
MQNPGEAVTSLASRSSTSALWSRVLARGRGTAMPFSASQAVRAEDWAGNQKLTVWNTHWFWWDNIVLLTLAFPAGFVWIMNRVPK